MDVIKFTKPRNFGDGCLYEVDPNYTRETANLLGGDSVATMAALGQISLGSGSATAASAVSGSGGTVGNGVMGSITVASGTPPGLYRLTITNPVTNAGAFEVVRMADGVVIGEGTVAVAFSHGGLGFTLADGSNDWVEDDFIDITVTDAAGAGQLVPINFSATDGSQNLVGFAIHGVTAPVSVDTPCDYLARGPAIIRAEEIVWPVGATDNQKAAASAQALAKGILVRASG